MRVSKDQPTAFREDFNMRGREDQDDETPRDRSNGMFLQQEAATSVVQGSEGAVWQRCQPFVEQWRRGELVAFQAGGSPPTPWCHPRRGLQRRPWHFLQSRKKIPQVGGGETRHGVAETGGGVAPAPMATAVPPATATSAAGERPDGVGSAIQKKVDKREATWIKNQLGQQQKMYGGLMAPVLEKIA